MITLDVPTDKVELSRIILRLKGEVTVTTWSNTLHCPMRQLTDEQFNEGAQFLCKYKSKWFVSTIKYEKEFGYYVDPKDKTGVIELLELDNIQLIEGTLE